jgi:hypothetical protein
MLKGEVEDIIQVYETPVAMFKGGGGIWKCIGRCDHQQRNSDKSVI